MQEKTLKFTMADIETLIPYARNARIHTDGHVAQLAGSIREFGFNVPVLIDEDRNVIAGHGRLLAARKLGMTEVPVAIASHMTEAQRKAYIIADNKLHDNSSFDYTLLQLDLDELKEGGFDLALLGFEDVEVNFASSGWESDIDIPEGDGVNLDGIPSNIRIEVKNDDEDGAKAAITAALDEAGIGYQFR